MPLHEVTQIIATLNLFWLQCYLIKSSAAESIIHSSPTTDTEVTNIMPTQSTCKLSPSCLKHLIQSNNVLAL